MSSRRLGARRGELVAALLELMLLARGGLDAAFARLIRRYQAHPTLAVRYAGRESRAADVAQDTFVEVVRALPQYQAKAKFS